jgi:predicted aldo/keto reductase-like oxidoreductase
LKSAVLAGAGTLATHHPANAQEASMSQNAGNDQRSTFAVPRRAFGRTGEQVSIFGLGGFHLGSTKDQQETSTIVSKAIDAGVNFFDNAWEYNEGESEERLGIALQGKRDKVILMTKVCSHGRDKKVAMEQLEQSLRRLKTDHLDVWQIHEVVYYNDPDLIFRPDGAIEALEQAKKDGKVRWVGFTGHKDPAIHLKMLSHDFPFDTTQMPLNCFDARFRTFQQIVLPEANRRGIAVLGMKSLGGSGEMVTHGGITPEEGLRYAMSLPVATTISGVDSEIVLEQNRAIASNFKPMTAENGGPSKIAASFGPRTAASSVSRPQRCTTERSDASSISILKRKSCRRSWPDHFTSAVELPAGGAVATGSTGTGGRS